ncbi:MAG TPA: DEAD/DEAH box helicase family protein, partial [Thiotrichales bacterium]|nr:DEAD/DEAH box helicase family protein [Thiotrichales bacterium]
MRGKIQRRAHQQLAVNDILATYATSSKAQINMACGTGKTLIAYFVKEDISARLTTVFVPSLFLISQVQKEWSKGAVSSGRPFQSLFVCSDETVNVGSDDIVITEEELAELGGEVTSNV